MFGLFKKKPLNEPDLRFAAKGYLQVVITRRYRPNLNLHVIERGYAEQLLEEGCTLNQAFSARWGGVYAINDDLCNFDDALASARSARQESGMPNKMGTKEEADAMYLVSAIAVVTLFHTLYPKEYQNFRDYIGVDK